MPLAAQLVLAAALALAAAGTYRDGNAALDVLLHNSRGIRAMDAEVPAGCLYEGRWFLPGAGVATRDACLRCTCARGALACARRSCAAPPAHPPPRCHLRHRRGACCPELHCPDGVTVLEQDATARAELDEPPPAHAHAAAAGRHACVSGGAVFAAGSALEARAACEQCFCLGGARRCVRPRCLPAPPACRARPAPGACCPARYYCDPPGNATATVSPPPTTHSPHRARTHDCKVNGKWVPEGERVAAGWAGAADNCSSCFCLRGAVSCAPLACAPPAPLHGCAPLLRAGQCCAHRYRCDHPPHESVPHDYKQISDNALIATRNDDRSFHSTKSNKQETTTGMISTSGITTRHVPAVPRSPTELSTTKVKRKTNDPPPTPAGTRPREDTTKTTAAATHKRSDAAAKIVASTTEVAPTEEPVDETTEQPEASVKVMINGTINCNAEISSTSIPLNTTANDAEKLNLEALPRAPYLGDRIIEAHTSNPNDIITDRNDGGGFDENETFTIKVTSSLRTNTSHSTSPPSLTTVSTGEHHMPSGIADALNISKNTKEDYDYDYTEPTLPPSLPNLKIIPFVAADAVVDDDAPKPSLTYPLSEREDKFPVYYPSVESKQTPFAIRREDVYQPAQYPVFVNDKLEASHHPPRTHDLDVPRPGAVTSQHAHVLGKQPAELNRVATKPPSKSSTIDIKAPSVNLFSPPIETEGGFIPKGPGILGEYYAVYPSTPSPPSVPHLTTSMPLDTGNGECISGEGRRVADGEAVTLACSVCTCAWGALRCAPRACAAPPPGCARLPPASSQAADPCCGEVTCQQDPTSTPSPAPTTQEVEITSQESKAPVEIKSEILLFDPPPDRSVPLVNDTVTEKHIQVDVSNTNDTEKVVFPQNVTTAATVSDPTGNVTSTKETTTTDAVSSKSTEKPVPTTVTTAAAHFEDHGESNDTSNQSQEYEDEEEDEGFSFGSVLKLLLSDSYDSTTASPHKKKPTPPTAPTATTVHFTTTVPPPPKSTTRRIMTKPTVAPFVPMPHHPYAPPKKVLPQNTVNRIDHLVLGEATAIKKTTRPTSPKPFTVRTTSPVPTTTRFVVAKKEGPGATVGPAAAAGAGAGGPPRVAGCNIYGRMYRVGRIIAELSSPCQECRCTELGVQCRALAC